MCYLHGAHRAGAVYVAEAPPFNPHVTWNTRFFGITFSTLKALVLISINVAQHLVLGRVADFVGLHDGQKKCCKIFGSAPQMATFETNTRLYLGRPPVIRKFKKNG